jgi:hypothetical protein
LNYVARRLQSVAGEQADSIPVFNHRFVARIMIASFHRAILLCAVLVSPGLLWAQSIAFGEQESENSSTQPAQVQSTTYPLQMEELIVIGERPTSVLRREMFDTQDQVYEMFNTLNEEREYDMICHKEARIGSQIKYQVCKPAFMWKAISEASEDTLLDAGFGIGSVHTLNQAELNGKARYQRELMARLANENLQFLSLLKKRLVLRKEYEARFKEGWWRKGSD